MNLIIIDQRIHVSITTMNVQGRETHCEAQYKRVKVDAEKIHVLVKENLDYFQAEEDSDNWRRYVDHLDDIVLDGLFECIQCSLRYLMENTDKEKDVPPLLMAKMELLVYIMAPFTEYYHL